MSRWCSITITVCPLEIKAFSEINSLLSPEYPAKNLAQKTSINFVDVVKLHLRKIYDHYEPFGPDLGVRIARKHVGWYIEQLDRFKPNATQNWRVSVPLPAEPLALGVLANPQLSARSSSRQAGSARSVLAVSAQTETQANTTRDLRRQFNRLEQKDAQLAFVEQIFGELQTGETAA